MWGADSERRAFGDIGSLWHGGPEVRHRRRAVERRRPVAGQGSATAQLTLGWACCDGDGVARDYAKFSAYCLAAAERGYPAAENMTGSYLAIAKPEHLA